VFYVIMHSFYNTLVFSAFSVCFTANDIINTANTNDDDTYISLEL